MSDDPKNSRIHLTLGPHLADPDRRILDASWYLPAIGTRTVAGRKYQAAISRRRYFDI